MSEYVDFHYMPLEGKITGEQVLKQTEDAINDLGNKVYNLDIDQSEIDEAIEKSNEAINTANSALSAVTTGRSVWFNNVAEMVATDIEAGVTAETKGYYVANDGGNALYLIRQEKSGDVVDGGSLIALDNGNMAELVTDGTVNVKQFGAIGNGTDDDTTVFQNTSSYAQANGFVPFVGVATYKITGNVTGTFNSFGEVTITGGGTVDIINLHEVVSDVSDIRDEVVDETASAKAYSESAETSATNASNSASSASTTATQLMEYLETKETLTAPAIDPTLTISGAAADAKVTGDKANNVSYPNMTFNSGWNTKTFPVEFAAGTSYIITSTQDISYCVLYVDSTMAVNTGASIGSLVANTPKTFSPNRDGAFLRFFSTSSGVVSIKMASDKDSIIAVSYNQSTTALGIANKNSENLNYTEEALGINEEFNFSFQAGSAWATKPFIAKKGIYYKVVCTGVTSTAYLRFVNQGGVDVTGSPNTYTALNNTRIIQPLDDVVNIQCTALENVTFEVTPYNSAFDLFSELMPLISAQNHYDCITPSHIRIGAGRQMNLYYQNILRYYNANSLQLADSGGVLGYAPKYGRKNTDVNDSASDFTSKIRFGLYGTYNYGALLNPVLNLNTQTMNFSVIPHSAGNGLTKKVLFIGDSMTAAGVYPNEIVRMFADDPMSVELIGTLQSPNAPYAHNEGRGGWRAYTYCRCAVGSDDIAGLQGTNPFYNNGHFDFSKYMTDNNYDSVNYVFICLGMNDVAPSRPLHQTDADILEYWNEMIDSIHDFDANIKIALWLTPVGAMMSNYNKQNMDSTLRIVRLLIDSYDNRENELIYLCPVYLNIDPEHDYPYTIEHCSDRNTDTTFDVPVAIDYVHPSAFGYYKCADVIYGLIKFFGSIEAV